MARPFMMFNKCNSAGTSSLEARHPECNEGSPDRNTVPMSEIPRCTRDDVFLFQCLPHRGWGTQDDVPHEMT